MPLPVPKPASMSTSPSTGPAAARAVAQDAQIAQLVQQVRTLERTISQLDTALEAEKARGIATVNQIREQWRAERKEWRDGCDALQSKHRLAHLGTRVALEHERGQRLEDKEVLVREKVARLLREHKITLFQARETDLVAQVAALEEEIDRHREESREIMHQHEAEVARLTARLAKSDALWQERANELGDSTREKKALEIELTTLQKQIERLTLKIETLRTQTAASEDRNRELQHQVDKWQSLEGKGEKEVVELRKRRIDLEVRVKELEVSLKETRGFDKKVAKLEASLLETHEQVEQGHQDVIEAQAEAEQARKQAAKLERQVVKLQTALEAEKTRSAEAREDQDKVRTLSDPSSSRGRLQVPAAIQEVSENSDDEIVPVKPPSRRQKPASTRSAMAKARERPVRHNGSEEPERSKRGNKGKGKAKEINQAGEEDGEMLEDKRSKGNSKGKGKEDGEILEDEGDVEQEVQPPAQTILELLDEDRDSDIVEVAPPTQKPRSRSAQTRPVDDRDVTKKPRSKSGKERISDVGEPDEQETGPKKRPRSKPARTGDDLNGKKQASSHMETTDAEGDDEQPQKKKKRKLNLTAGSGIFSGPAAFTWDQDGAGDLGIPSELSPVKEGQRVPARSGSSSLLGGWRLWRS